MAETRRPSPARPRDRTRCRRCVADAAVDLEPLDPVGVGADEYRPRGAKGRPCPPRSSPGMPASTTRPVGFTTDERLGDRVGRSDAVHDGVRSSGEPGRRLERAGPAPYRTGELVRRHRDVGAELCGEPRLVRVARPAMSVPGGLRCRKAATVASPSVPAPSTATTASSRPASAASAAWTAHAEGSTITASSSVTSSGTGWSCDSCATSPPPTNRLRCRRSSRSAVPARCCPNATCSHPPGSPFAHRRARRRDRPGHAADSGFRPRTRRRDVPVVAVVGDHAHDLVAGDEGEADEVLEVARAPAVEGGEVRAADSCEKRPPHRCQSGSGQFGRFGVDEPQRPDRGRASRAGDGGHDPWRLRTGRRCARARGPSSSTSSATSNRSHQRETPVVQRAHRQQASASRLLPDAQCSVCHPLRRAMAASFASGLTATGNPTHSRSGRSDAESA